MGGKAGVEWAREGGALLRSACAEGAWSLDLDPEPGLAGRAPAPAGKKPRGSSELNPRAVGRL